MGIFDRYRGHVVIVLSILVWQIRAQELEPRAINNLPVGTNFILGGYSYAHGNMLLDAALPIEGLNSSIHTGVVAYIRSIRFLGFSSKIDLVLPFVQAEFSDAVEPFDGETTRSGLGDLRARFSFNFIGSKAMNIEEFHNYSPDFVSGISVQLIVPTGRYDPNYLINPGSNRWVFKTQWGMAKNLDKWSLEGYVAAWFYGMNNNFLNGNNLSQEPLFTIKAHAIRALKNKNWMSFSMGYAVGGITEVNGNQRETQISTMRFAFNYSLPLNDRSSLKLSAVTSIRFQRGVDYNGLSIIYQYRWLKGS